MGSGFKDSILGDKAFKGTLPLRVSLSCFFVVAAYKGRPLRLEVLRRLEACRVFVEHESLSFCFIFHKRAGGFRHVGFQSEFQAGV